MAPRDVGRAYAIGRAVIGGALLLSPRLALTPFFGAEANSPAACVLARAAGARDVVIGMIALHTLDSAEIGPRWQRTCAVVDAVDGLSMLAARRELSPLGVAAVVAAAAGGAATGAWTARALAAAGAQPAG